MQGRISATSLGDGTMYSSHLHCCRYVRPGLYHNNSTYIQRVFSVKCRIHAVADCRKICSLLASAAPLTSRKSGCRVCVTGYIVRSHPPRVTSRDTAARPAAGYTRAGEPSLYWHAWRATWEGSPASRRADRIRPRRSRPRARL
jgi:hypothetical protein